MCTSHRSKASTVGDDDVVSTDDLLEAFRRKKAEAAAAGGSASSHDSSRGEDGTDDSADENIPDAPTTSTTPTGPADRPLYSAKAPLPRGPAGASVGVPDDAPGKPSPEPEEPEASPAPKDEASTAGDEPAKEPTPAPSIPDDPPPEESTTQEPDSELPATEPASRADADPEPSTSANDPEAEAGMERTAGTDSRHEPLNPPEKVPEEEAPASPSEEVPATPPNESAETATEQPEAGASVPVNQTVPGADRVVDATHRPRSPAPGTRTLAPLDPALGLANRIRQDALVTRPAWAVGRYAALMVTALGLLLLTLDRYMVAVAGHVVIGGIRLTGIAIALTAAAGLTAAILWFMAKERQVTVQFASSQADEWRRAESRVRLFRILRWVGLGLMAGGPLVAIIILAASPTPSNGIYGILGMAVLGVGAFLAVASHFMHHIAVRNYIQTTVLWILERTGGAVEGTAQDPRVPGVLKSLDGLLAELPDSAVAAFMQTPEAKAYLELMDSLPEV